MPRWNMTSDLMSNQKRFHRSRTKLFHMFYGQGGLRSPKFCVYSKMVLGKIILFVIGFEHKSLFLQHKSLLT